MNHARYDKLQSEYRLIRDCLEGEQAIKDAGALYTPQPDGMSAQNFNNYIARGTFYDAPAMTLRALVGLALRKDPVIKLPARLEPMRLDASYDNAPMSVLIEDMVREVMAMGRYGVLLDFPVAGASVNTVPHISTFEAEAIEDFQTAYVEGRKVLTRVWLASDETYEDAEVSYELILEDSIYKFRRFIRDRNQTHVEVGEEVIPTVNGKALDYIPFLLVSHEGIRPEEVRPPFSGLCRVAISHFRNSCDREHAIFLTSAPTPWISGNLPADRVPTQIGAGALWTLPEGAQCGISRAFTDTPQLPLGDIFHGIGC